MHLRAASSPSTALKPTPARSESAKPTSKATAASSGRRTSSLTSSSELPRPSRRHSAQVAASTRQADKENAPPVDKPALDNSKAGGGLENVKIVEMSTSSNSTKTKITAAAATALKPKSSNFKAFQSTVSPLMHFDEPAPVPTALFSGLAISGGVSPSHDSSSSATRSFSGPAALQQQQHALSASYAAQQSGYLSVPTSPAPFYNPAAGFGLSSAAAVYNPAAAAYYYPTDFSAFFHHSQGYTVPSPPGTPLSTSTGAISPSPSSSAATTTTTGNNNNHQQPLYPPSLGLGHPYWYTPTTTTPSSANTSLSLSSVAASSLGLSPANSRSTSASSVASAGVAVGRADKVATAAAAHTAALVYPIPYAYSTPFAAATAVPAPPARGGDTTTIRERLEGGAVLSSKGACKFFDVEKGFGFIIDDHAEELGADVFIHYTGIEQTRGFRCLAQKERVEYALVKHSSGRFQALKLRGENGAPLKGLDDPRQAAAFDRMNSKAAAIWSEDEENVCPPGRGSVKGRHRRGLAPAYYKGNVRAPPPPRIRRTPAEDDEAEDEGDSCVEVEEE